MLSILEAVIAILQSNIYEEEKAGDQHFVTDQVQEGFKMSLIVERH